jgi:hypothetical protein
MGKGEENMGNAHSILEGAIDLHVHGNPDLYARPFDEIEIVQRANEVGYRGVLFKSHHTTNADRAFILNKLIGGVRVLGNITLNQTVGGINPQAVYAAAKLGVTEVKMPTVHAAHHIQIMGATYDFFDEEFAPVLSEQKGITILDEKGRLIPQIYEIFEIIKEHNLLLGTGHLSRDEVMLLVKEARKAKVERVLVTHAESVLTDLPVEDQVELAEMGAFIEHNFTICMPIYLTGKKGKRDPEEIGGNIRKVGAQRCTMGTDFGQFFNPEPVEGMRMFVRTMMKCGITSDEIDWMIRKNPAWLVGLD